jgi:hypothetical protein
VRLCAAAAVACALACGGWPAAARGAEVTAAQLRALASEAQHDPASLARLRDVDVVDGRAVAVDEALRGTDAEVRGRLRALAQEGWPPAGPAAGPGAPVARAREQARDVLAQRRFQPSAVPAPLRSVRKRIGEWLRRPFAAAFHWIASWLPGGSLVLWALLAALVLGAAGALAARAGVHRRLAAGGAADVEGGRERLSAAQLTREAERAERAGDLDAALRLRFRAGLLELDSRELIELRPALTNRELLRDVPSPTLAGLVDGFEAVAYGGRPAAPDDVRSARDGWPRVPEEAGTR